MGRRFKLSLRSGSALAVACAAALAASAGGSAAGERVAAINPGQSVERVIYVAVGEPTRAPIGWVEFCAEYKP